MRVQLRVGVRRGRDLAIRNGRPRRSADRSSATLSSFAGATSTGAHTPNPHGAPPAPGPTGYPTATGLVPKARPPPGHRSPVGTHPRSSPISRPVGALPPLGAISLARGGLRSRSPRPIPMASSRPAGESALRRSGSRAGTLGHRVLCTMAPSSFMALVGIGWAGGQSAGSRAAAADDRRIARLWSTKLHDAVEMFCAWLHATARRVCAGRLDRIECAARGDGAKSQPLAWVHGRRRGARPLDRCGGPARLARRLARCAGGGRNIFADSCVTRWPCSTA